MSPDAEVSGLVIGSRLSAEDVQRLAREPRAENRLEVAVKLAHELDNQELAASELAMTQEIVALFARDVEVSVRTALAENLRNSKRIPRDLALHLANDMESVALPIIESSSVLTQTDIINIVRHGSSAKQEAVARRTDVSEPVADALVNFGSERAVATLMENTTAQIAEKSLNKAIERFQESDSVKTAMVRRNNLPLAIAERLINLVSDRLREQLITHNNISHDITSDLLLQSREKTIMLFAQNRTLKELEELVEQMHSTERLTTSILLRALCLGDTTFVELALAKMADIPLFNAQLLIHDSGRLGFRTVWDKAGLPSRYFPTARTILDVIQETEIGTGEHDMEKYRATIIERVLTQMQDLSDDDTEYLLAKLGDMIKVVL